MGFMQAWNKGKLEHINRTIQENVQYKAVCNNRNVDGQIYIYQVAVPLVKKHLLYENPPAVL